MTVPPPQVPYGPPPTGDNPYAAAPQPQPYAAQPYPPQPSAPGQPLPHQPAPPGYGYPTGPEPGYGQAYAAPGGPVCRFCGGFPAVDTAVRGHQGLIIIMRFLKQPGPFCRTCGTAMVRDMSASTLVLGWWGYLSALFTPITLLRNLAAHNRIKQLPPPAPGTHGPQLDPGVPLTKRPQIFMLLLPVLSITSMILLLATGAFGGRDRAPAPYAYDAPFTMPSPSAMPSFSMPSFSIPPIPEFSSPAARPSAPPSRVPSDVERAKAGDCLRNENQNGPSATKDPNPRITMLDCSDARAQYKVVAKVLGTTDAESACEKYPTAESWFRRDAGSTGTSFVLCLAPVNGKVPTS
ncbi:LppU/SCO3897 family protein [Kitasatospora sp. NPDC054939]